MDLEFESWNRFVMRGFAVKTDVLGLAHRYRFEGFRVKVELPAKDKLGKEPNEGDQVSFDSWREIDGCKVPEFVWVHSVDVSVQSPKTISMPHEVLGQHANALDIFTAERQADLNKVTEQFKGIGERAFDVWVRTLRWKSNDGSIGRPEILDFRSGWSTYLRERKTKKTVWIATETLFVRGATALTLEKWRETQSFLRRGLMPPVSYDLMSDAVEHLKSGDLKRAAVDLAVACECHVRSLVLQHLPRSTEEVFKDHIDLANITTVLNKFLPSLLTPSEKIILKRIEKPLRLLFTARNDIVHSGVKSLAPEDVREYLSATRELLSLRGKGGRPLRERHGV